LLLKNGRNGKKMQRKKISIISGCYNEQDNIKPLYERISTVMSQFPQYDYEIIIIDNCSKDKTSEVLREIAATDNRVKVILNARNFGVNRSGLYVHKFVAGNCMICLASDLEDPPELIAEFLKKWEQGYKMVAAIKKGSKENILMRAVRSVYYKIIYAISEIEQIKNFTGFGLYDMSIIKPLLEYYDSTTYFRGLVSEYGYDISFVEFVKPVRPSGKSSYNFFSYFDYAMLGIVSNSKVPIRIATLAGFCLSGLSLLVALFYFVFKLLFWSSVPFGIAPLVIGLFFFSSVQIFFIGLIGEYVAAVLSKVSPKPLVLVREFINFEDSEDVTKKK
jgi:glycosyltransferase involved in cell wall biosynthesis